MGSLIFLLKCSTECLPEVEGDSITTKIIAFLILLLMISISIWIGDKFGKDGFHPI